MTRLMAEWNKCHEQYSADQGHINYLVYSGDLARYSTTVKVWLYGNKYVAHLGFPIKRYSYGDPPLAAGANGQMEVLTYRAADDKDNGKVVAIVHQYTRSSELTAWARGRWGYTQTWRKSAQHIEGNM